ncbi:hypothetical protein [Mycobacterium paraterrae]|uniref:Uncharacterized protein n=1 Tax=Mycobacterium paraterrae TaxID=577492 RepID=A0ABY3VKA8_9MYCO|nr:hypothetical protein [Mycobacterium paraterrae]UMB67938.1 hypothetical protein MKK62_15790 [Mycobacterium paraterrae]
MNTLTSNDLRIRRRLGTGVALGGMLCAVMGQLVGAPTARADDPLSELLNNVQAAVEIGNVYLNAAAMDFSAGLSIPGTSAGLIGLDNVLIAPEENALLDTVDALTNTPVHAVIGFEPLSGPTDWASALVQIQGFADAANVDFTQAANFMTAGDFPAAELLDIEGFNALWVEAPNAAILGLVESSLGF